MVQLKVPLRSVQEEVLRKQEVRQLPDDLRNYEHWFYPCFALWLSTGLRNAKLIGLTWDCVRLDEGELLISKTLRRDGTATHQRLWSGTKTGKAHMVPLSQQVITVLKHTMQCLDLNTKGDFLFVMPMDS